jgi:hypothetical protein
VQTVISVANSTLPQAHDLTSLQRGGREVRQDKTKGTAAQEREGHVRIAVRRAPCFIGATCRAGRALEHLRLGERDVESGEDDREGEGELHVFFCSFCFCFFC